MNEEEHEEFQAIDEQMRLASELAAPEEPEAFDPMNHPEALRVRMAWLEEFNQILSGWSSTMPLAVDMEAVVVTREVSLFCVCLNLARRVAYLESKLNGIASAIADDGK